jgi:hypothetical protein
VFDERNMRTELACGLTGAVAGGRAGTEDNQVIVVGCHLSPVFGVNGGVTVVW